MRATKVLFLAAMAFSLSGLSMGDVTAECGGGVGAKNPAAVKCGVDGGTYEIRKVANGGEAGVCVWDESECGGWSYFHGDCLRKTCAEWSVDDNSCKTPVQATCTDAVAVLPACGCDTTETVTETAVVSQDVVVVTPVVAACDTVICDTVACDTVVTEAASVVATCTGCANEEVGSTEQTGASIDCGCDTFVTQTVVTTGCGDQACTCPGECTCPARGEKGFTGQTDQTGDSNGCGCETAAVSQTSTVVTTGCGEPGCTCPGECTCPSRNNTAVVTADMPS